MSDTLETRPPADHPEPATAGTPDPLPSAQQPPPVAGKREPVTCPECGTRAEVTLARRESNDFCARCDFPLFWTPATIQLGEGATAEEALRRLPGTAGRVTVASATCPHCNEANPLAATTCTRCGRSMDVEPPPPPPAYVPPPPPPPAPEPAKPVSLWVWAFLALTGVVFAALVVWLVLEA